MKFVNKKYIIESVEGKGKITVTRTNEGFTALELLGLMNLISQELTQLIADQNKPDEFKRIYVITEAKK